MRLGRILTVLGLGLLLQACAANDGPPPAPDAFSATRTLSTTYEYIQDNYSGSAPLLRIGLAGLRNLRTLEPDLTVTQVPPFITVELRGQTIRRFRQPISPYQWAEATRDSIEALVAASPTVAELTWVETVDAVLQGAAAGLDEESVYISRSDVVAAGLEYGGQSGVIGIVLQREGKGPAAPPPVIAQVRRGSTAEAAGLRAGDSLVAIDGRPGDTLRGLDLDFVLVGPTRSEARVEVIRDGEAMTFAVSREVLEMDKPGVDRLGDLLYLQLSTLNMATVEAVKETLTAELAKTEGRPKGLVLDLRGTPGRNPWVGGFFMEMFTDRGNFYAMRGRHHRHSNTFRSRSKLLFGDLPMVVLVNGHTVAAAEAVAAGFADTGRAVVVGSTTYGAGGVQTAPVLLNGGFFVLTTSYLYTAASNPIDGLGVLPTVCTDDVATSEEALATLRRGQGVFSAAQRNTKGATPRMLCPLKLSQDESDLDLAVALLNDPGLYRRVLEAGRSQPPKS